MSMPSQTADSCTNDRVMIRLRPLARELGVAESTLRYWERSGRIPPAERTPLGTRVWDRAAVVAAVEAGWPGRLAGPRVPGGQTPKLALAPRGHAVLPQPEHDPLGTVIAKVVARAADKAVREWLTKLLEKGDRTRGVVGAAAAKK